MLSEGKLTTLLHPVVASEDHSIYGFEALARGGYAEFFSAPELFRAAEEGEMVTELTAGCRRSALEHLSSLAPEQKLFINFHEKDLTDPRIHGGAPDEPLFSCRPEQIVIELSDVDLLHSREETLETVRWLKSRGFGIAIDNMGGDTSAICDVKKFSPDYIKVDRSLTRAIHKSRSKRALVETIKEMANEQGAKLVVEGIESEEELRVARDLGAEYCQGFYFSIPRPSVISRADFSHGYSITNPEDSLAILDDMKYATIRRLTELNAELLKKLRTRDRFIAYVVHDLKSPLTAIRLNADTLVDSGHGARDENVRGSIDSIASESDRLCRLVDELLEFAVMQSSGVTLSLEDRDICDLVRKCLQSHSRAAQSKSLYLKFDSSADQVMAIVDADQLARVLDNLIANAICFTSSGGVWVSLCPREGEFSICVTDSGHGIEKENLGKIFEPFVKFGNPEGTGIGLAVAKSVVGAHQGRISVESTPGKGSIFTITMPYQSVAAS